MEETTTELKKMASALEKEKERTDQLLRELLPPSVAELLSQGKQVEAGMWAKKPKHLEPYSPYLFASLAMASYVCLRLS